MIHEASRFAVYDLVSAIDFFDLLPENSAFPQQQLLVTVRALLRRPSLPILSDSEVSQILPCEASRAQAHQGCALRAGHLSLSITPLLSTATNGGVLCLPFQRSVIFETAPHDAIEASSDPGKWPGMDRECRL